MVPSAELKKVIYVTVGLLILTSGAFFSYGQSPVTLINGIIRDNVTRKGLEGVYISLTSPNEIKTTITDGDGKFEIAPVMPGRYVCRTSLLGYEATELEILVIAGKTSSLIIELQEGTLELEEVAVQGRAHAPGEETAISLPIEKVLRIPANFFDPIRMLSSYAGVMTANDQANNVVVKGNSPNGLLWRLNGMDIVNPNHLANAGTFSDKPSANGGGVNILSAQMLDRTDFYSGNVPSRFGNVSSGVLDMNLRGGNGDQNEFTAQASLIGLDISAEGPLRRNQSSSFLANYRYSTVGLLSQLGVNFGGEEISFQDFSFHLKSAVGARGAVSFFGLGGLSKNNFKAKDSVDWEVEKDMFDISYKSGMFALGVRHDQQLKKDMSFSSGVTLSANEQNRDSKAVSTVSISTIQGRESTFTSNRTLISSFVNLSAKITSSLKSEAGMMVNYYGDGLTFIERASGTSSATVTDNSKASFLMQPYLHLNYFAGRFSTEVGGRYMHSTLSGNSSVDYRGHIQYRLTQLSSLSLSVGRLSQQHQPGVFLVSGNEVLDFMSKHFVEFGHLLKLQEWKINSAIYYQKYSKVPVLPATSFSVLNFMDGVAPSDLVSSGSGNNSGFTFQLERSFLSSFYLLAGGSVYDSRYTGGDRIERKTRFDGKYAAQLTLGREKIKQAQDRTKAFGIHSRFLFLGGLRDTPIDEPVSRDQGQTVYKDQEAFDLALKDYMRLDLRLSWRKDKKGYTRTISLDVQNLTGTKNEAYRYFDAYLDEVKTQYQIGLIPVLVYRVDF